METDRTSSTKGALGSRARVRLYRIRSIAKRYWWVLALTIACGMLFQAWRVWRQPEQFVSTGKLHVRDTVATRTPGDESWLSTIPAVIVSPANLERAATRLVRENPAFEARLQAVTVTAERDPGTYLFTVRGTGRDPEAARAYAASVMEAFLEKRRSDLREDWRGRAEPLIQSLEQDRSALADAQGRLALFKDDQAIPFLIEERERIAVDLSAAKKNRDQLLQQIATYESLDAASLLRADASARAGELLGAERSGELFKAQKELAAAKAEWELSGGGGQAGSGGQSPMEAEIRRLESQLQVLGTEANEGRKAAIERFKAELAAVNRAIEALEITARNSARTIDQFETMKAEVERRRTHLEQQETLIAQQRAGAVGGDLLEITQPASPAIAERPRMVWHLSLGLAAGLVVGLLILVFLDRADDRLASSSEMMEAFSEPILGQIPDVAGSRTSQGLPLLREEDDRYMFAEAFRSLRSSLIFMPNQSELKTLIVTSAIPNEGKSTVASNLAITMAHAGARVLLVDADLRRGDIAALFDTDGRQGLSNILRGEVRWRACVQEVRPGRLDVIPRGPVTNQSGELLLRPIVPKLLEEWKATYDLVLFNTAPILATDDTPTLAPNFDGTLMIIRASFTSARLTRNALNSLYQRRVNVLGLIMNCVDTELPDYYYYRYPKYYAA